MRAVPNTRELGVDRPLIQVGRAHQVSQRLGGIKEHGVSHASHASHPQTQADARKDEGVVPLPNAVRLSATNRLHRRVRPACSRKAWSWRWPPSCRTRRAGASEPVISRAAENMRELLARLNRDAKVLYFTGFSEPAL